MPFSPDFLAGPNGRIAYFRLPGRGPGVVFFSGFASDMTGTKASFLDVWAREAGRAFLRFDYSGHGQSDGAFEDGCVSDWTADALAAFDALTEGPQILIGSSMGAWIASLVAMRRPDRIAAAIFVAPAPDFTQTLLWAGLSADQQAELMRAGSIDIAFDEGPLPITRRLIEDGRENLVLGAPIAIDAPVRILQGMADADVPYPHAIRFAEGIASPDLELTLIKGGDHSLSSPADLARLAAVIEALA